MHEGSWRAVLARLRRRLAQHRWRSARRLAASGPMWTVLACAFVAVILLGTIGFTEYQQQHWDRLAPFATRLYLSMQLLVLESGAVPGSVPWQLDVARFAAPLLAAFAVLQTLAAVLHTQVETLRLQIVRDHVVVAGLGRKGRLLAQRLLERGGRVVVIEADDDNAELDTLRALGGLVVVGDARTPETQRRARVARASHVVAICGDDGANTDIVATARGQIQGTRSRALQCVAQLTDPDLCLMLCREELERYGQVPVRMDFVNVYAAGSLELARMHPPWDSAGGTPVVVGAGPTARHLLPALARSWAAHLPEPTAAPLRVTVVGMGEPPLEALRRRHPELTRFTELRTSEDLRTSVSEACPGVTYICPDDDGTAVTTALRVRDMVPDPRSRIVVVLEESSGLSRLLHGIHLPDRPDLATFALLQETCKPEVLLSGTTELLAQAMHRAYVDMYAYAATGSAAEPALQPWNRLPDSLRESNRDQAAHVAVKLATIGRTVGPLVDWESAQEEFTDSEVESLARLEHDRWVNERRRAGWRPGPRDPHRLTSPYLVAWEQLSEEVRESDRMFVRRLPELLASVGLQAHRLPGATRVVAKGQDRPLETGRPTDQHP